MYLSPGESPRTITTSCLWALLWFRCSHLPVQSRGSDWHINSSSTPLSPCCVQTECHIVALERLICNGSSANGIPPSWYIGGYALWSWSQSNKKYVCCRYVPTVFPVFFFPLSLTFKWKMSFSWLVPYIISSYFPSAASGKAKRQQSYIFM